jgi:hypothetical protein
MAYKRTLSVSIPEFTARQRLVKYFTSMGYKEIPAISYEPLPARIEEETYGYGPVTAISYESAFGGGPALIFERRTGKKINLSVKPLHWHSKFQVFIKTQPDKVDLLIIHEGNSDLGGWTNVSAIEEIKNLETALLRNEFLPVKTRGIIAKSGFSLLIYILKEIAASLVGILALYAVAGLITILILDHVVDDLSNAYFLGIFLSYALFYLLTIIWIKWRRKRAAKPRDFNRGV